MEKGHNSEQLNIPVSTHKIHLLSTDTRFKHLSPLTIYELNCEWADSITNLCNRLAWRRYTSVLSVFNNWIHFSTAKQHPNQTKWSLVFRNFVGTNSENVLWVYNIVDVIESYDKEKKTIP